MICWMVYLHILSATQSDPRHCGCPALTAQSMSLQAHHTTMIILSLHCIGQNSSPKILTETYLDIPRVTCPSVFELCNFHCHGRCPYFKGVQLSIASTSDKQSRCSVLARCSDKTLYNKPPNEAIKTLLVACWWHNKYTVQRCRPEQTMPLLHPTRIVPQCRLLVETFRVFY